MARPSTSGLSLAPIAVVALAAAFAFRRLDDYDTFWHLAAGRWIALHRSIPGHDVLSHTVRDHPWINLQWAFDAALYLLHALGGPVLLQVAATAGYALSVWILLRLVCFHLADTAGALLVLAALLVMEERFAVRPEMVSFPLLAATLWILRYGRRHRGRGLFLLLPVMLVWVNVHALFVLGAFAILCAIAGALGARALPASIGGGSRWDAPSSRRLAIWGGAALLAVAVNPFGLAGVLFPVKLLSRIGGGSPAFRSIAEFRSPFDPEVGGLPIGIYKVLLVAGIAAAAAALVVELRRKGPKTREGLDLGGILFFAGLAALSVLARRNAAVFALGGAPYVARSVGALAGARLRGRLAAVAVTAAALLLLVFVVTGAYYRWNAQTRELGAGVLEGIFPIRAAAFAREARLPSKLYNDVAAGGYLAWDDPVGDGVFVDGRLEVYDTAFYADYVAAMYDQARWQAEADRFGIETVILAHRFENRRMLVERLVHDPTWALVYADEVAAIFVRAPGNEAAIARATAIQDAYNGRTRAALESGVPGWRYPAGRIEGTRAFARLLATIGDAEGSAQMWSRLLELGVTKREEVEVRLLLARHFAGTGRRDRAREESRRILEIAPGNAEARALYGAN